MNKGRGLLNTIACGGGTPPRQPPGRRRYSVQFVSLCLALLAIASCSRKPSANATSFPASNEVAGWTRASDIRTFEAADLWKYIDGEAERYLKARVQRVSTADYKFRNKVDAAVDIYTMQSPDGAAKIMDAEPVADAKSVPLGDAARLYGQSLVFRKGPELVRIVAYEGSAEVPQAMLDLGRNIAERITK
jgi:uncharacterized protein DUF6599